MTYLGVPVTFAANFSLLHRLIRRNHEERQRLLTDVIRLNPESPDSPALTAMLKQWCVAADGAFGFDPAKAAERFDAFSGGSRRAMRELGIISYRRKRERSPKSKAVVLTVADLEETYLSQEFAVFRRDAQLLNQQRVTGKMADPLRKGLWCPIQPVVQAQDVGQANAERELQSKVFCCAQAASRAEQGADFAESFIRRVVHDRYEQVTRQECGKLFVGDALSLDAAQQRRGHQHDPDPRLRQSLVDFSEQRRAEENVLLAEPDRDTERLE